MSKKLPNVEFIGWIKELKAKIRKAQNKVAFSINSQLLELYWELGRELALRQQNSNWGSNYIEKTAMELRSSFPRIKGFSRRNLYAMRQWYLFYSQESEFVPRGVAQIPWGHNRLIISKVKDLEEAQFYVAEIIENSWDRDTLEIQIGNGEEKKSDLDNKAKAHISIDLEREWEVFQKTYSSFLDMEATLTNLWSKTFQISSSLANDLELLLWAKWISIQKTHKKVRSARGGGKGGWYEPLGLPLEEPIRECFSRLGLLNKLGIDFVTFEYSWDDEYEVLRKWAKGYNPKQLF